MAATADDISQPSLIRTAPTARLFSQCALLFTPSVNGSLRTPPLVGALRPSFSNETPHRSPPKRSHCVDQGRRLIQLQGHIKSITSDVELRQQVEFKSQEYFRKIIPLNLLPRNMRTLFMDK